MLAHGPPVFCLGSVCTLCDSALSCQHDRWAHVADLPIAPLLSSLLLGCVCQAQGAGESLVQAAVTVALPRLSSSSVPSPSILSPGTPVLAPTVTPALSARVIPPYVPFKQLSVAKRDRIVAEGRAYLDGEARRGERDSDCVLFDAQCPIGRCFEAINRGAVERAKTYTSRYEHGCAGCCFFCQFPKDAVLQCRGPVGHANCEIRRPAE
jgi:hypothetical protein